MEIKWIEYEGKKILYCDFRGAKDETDMIDLLRQSIKIGSKNDQPCPVLSNFEGTYLSQGFMDEAKSLSKQYTQKIKKRALVGITGVKKILLKAYITLTGEQTNMVFDTEEDALKWLIS
jgi:hypothetical protein